MSRCVQTFDWYYIYIYIFMLLMCPIGGRQPPHRGSDPGGFTPAPCPLPALLLGQSSHQPPWTGSRSRRQWYFHGWSITEVQLTVTRKWYHATRTGVTHGGVIATETDCVPLRVLVREGPTSVREQHTHSSAHKHTNRETHTHSHPHAACTPSSHKHTQLLNPDTGCSHLSPVDVIT
jgi:hypothetical protein